MNAVTRLMGRRHQSRVILDDLARSADPTDRFAVGDALLELARSKPESVPPDLVQALVGDSDPLVAEKGSRGAETARAAASRTRTTDGGSVCNHHHLRAVGHGGRTGAGRALGVLVLALLRYMVVSPFATRAPATISTSVQHATVST